MSSSLKFIHIVDFFLMQNLKHMLPSVIPHSSCMDYCNIICPQKVMFVTDTAKMHSMTCAR